MLLYVFIIDLLNNIPYEVIIIVGIYLVLIFSLNTSNTFRHLEQGAIEGNLNCLYSLQRGERKIR